ncbi:MAG TPA: NUDIX domain-containing protein [Candidatus Omnitrophota bacterium]|nr:NUDIX domain-containing protein [Candidatus Omnitrophota bacterium]
MLIKGKFAEKRSLLFLQSSHAILLFNKKYVLQLRDNKPGISAPGQWTLFGGMLGEHETPLASMKRELSEELLIQPERFEYLWLIDYIDENEGQKIRSWFFTVDVTSVWHAHKVMEGQGAGMFSYLETKKLKMPPVMHVTLDRYQREVVS